MLEARGLTKHFDHVPAVDDVSFAVAAGEVFGLLGPNGAGKTTVVRMLAGLIMPTRGRATVGGGDPARQPDRVRRRVGVLTETPGLWERLSVYRNLITYARLYGLADAPARVARYLRAFDLWERRNDLAALLSKGMKQKVALARALLHDPDVLFLDEPTAGLDPQTAVAVRQIITELRARRKTIILCTHNLDEAERLCDRIAVLRTRVLALDTPDALRERLFGHRTIVRLGRVDNRAVAAARALPAVRDLHGDGLRLIVSLADPAGDTPALVRALVGAGAEIVEVREEHRTLEDVYLKLIQKG